MQSGSVPSDKGTGASERRKERRYEVQLRGELRHDGSCYAVHIADVSGSGALVFMENPPEAGIEAELWIEDFGILPIEIMHAGEHFCGVAIMNPAQHRDQLLSWLRQEVTTAPTAALP
jgi:PilZ domain